MNENTELIDTAVETVNAMDAHAMWAFLQETDIGDDLAEKALRVMPTSAYADFLRDHMIPNAPRPAEVTADDEHPYFTWTRNDAGQPVIVTKTEDEVLTALHTELTGPQNYLLDEALATLPPAKLAALTPVDPGDPFGRLRRQGQTALADALRLYCVAVADKRLPAQKGPRQLFEENAGAWNVLAYSVDAEPDKLLEELEKADVADDVVPALTDAMPLKLYREAVHEHPALFHPAPEVVDVTMVDPETPVYIAAAPLFTDGATEFTCTLVDRKLLSALLWLRVHATPAVFGAMPRQRGVSQLAPVFKAMGLADKAIIRIAGVEIQRGGNIVLLDKAKADQLLADATKSAAARFFGRFNRTGHFVGKDGEEVDPDKQVNKRTVTFDDDILAHDDFVDAHLGIFVATEPPKAMDDDGETKKGIDLDALAGSIGARRAAVVRLRMAWRDITQLKPAAIIDAADDDMLAAAGLAKFDPANVVTTDDGKKLWDDGELPADFDPDDCEFIRHDDGWSAPIPYDRAQAADHLRRKLVDDHVDDPLIFDDESLVAMFTKPLANAALRLLCPDAWAALDEC